jgi:peptide/nickel transport system substrate-binding protein
MRRTRGIALGLLLTCTLALAVGSAGTVMAQTKPEGELKFALYVTISPQWFDPGETTGFITPFWFLYAMHDALVKNMPGKTSAPCLAESWTVSADQKVYDFKLREGLKFHNGDPFTAEDVRFSFYRAKGYKILKDKVRDVEVAGPYRVRFHLQEPWPDFMTFYGTLVSGAGWIVPKKYVEQVGDDGFKKHPVGLGPYKFVSHTPGVELVLEAFEGYWRKVPSVKRLVLKSVPESTTRVAMLKRGEVDIAYLLEVPQAEEVKRDPKLKVAFTGGVASFYIDFFDMWDPKSPWADQRVRLAASHAIDRKALNAAETLSASRLNGGFVPKNL